MYSNICFFLAVPGPMVAIDGGNNLSFNNGNCDGFYDQSDGICFEFAGPPSSAAPTRTPLPTYYPSVTPTVAPSSSPTTNAPSISMAPSTSPSSAPSQSPTISAAPSVAPTISMAPTTVAKGKCGDLEQYEDQGCVVVNDWTSFVAALESASGAIVFCSFTIMHDNDVPAILNKDINVHCPSESCSIYGPSNHLRVEGNTHVLVSGFTFTGSQQTAVQIRTTSYSAVTTFCGCDFNK